MDDWFDNVNRVRITGKIWVFDSWNKETITITVKNSNGEDLLKDGSLVGLTFIGKEAGT